MTDTSDLTCSGCGEYVGNKLASRIEALEAKLAKALEALKYYADENRAGLPGEGPWGTTSDDFGRRARATLRELKDGDLG